MCGNGLAMCFAGHSSISLSNPYLAKSLIYINSNFKLTNQRFGGVATKNCGWFTCWTRITYSFCYLLGVYFVSFEKLCFKVCTTLILFLGSAKKQWQTDKLFCNF